MARARNIKPSFFSNDQLADNHPLGRLLFIGLWTLADFNGNLEWRPKRIKAQLLPFDDCNLEHLAIDLEQSGFIRFYSDGAGLWINIVNFTQHQNPHKNEKLKGTEIPSMDDNGFQVIDFEELTINRDLNRSTRDQNGSDPADSFNLIPDSLLPESGQTNENTNAMTKTNNNEKQHGDHDADVPGKDLPAAGELKRISDTARKLLGNDPGVNDSDYRSAGKKLH